MFRYITAIILLCAFAAQSFQRAVIVLTYYANTESFAKNCENIARPLLHCKGKCQMIKKIQQEEKKEQQSSERKDNSKNEIVFSSSFYPVIICKLPAKQSFSPVNSVGKEIKMSRLLLRPPIC